nr:MAG TPA: hypothetical protein [Caudoviricetes sp.]
MSISFCIYILLVVFIDLPPQVNGLSQLDHWQGNCRRRI